MKLGYCSMACFIWAYCHCCHADKEDELQCLQSVPSASPRRNISTPKVSFFLQGKNKTEEFEVENSS